MATERQWASRKGSGKEVNFKFEQEGQELEGYYVGCLENQGSEGKSTIHTFKKEDGEEVSIWGSAVIDDQLSKVEFGGYVLIKYLGLKKAKTGGRSYHDFEVFEDTSAPKVESEAPVVSGSKPAASSKKQPVAVEEEEDEDDLPF